MSAQQVSRERTILVLGVALLIALFVYGVWQMQRSSKLYLMPMIGALDNCLFAKSPELSWQGCKGSRKSAATLIESTLQSLGPAVSQDGHIEVGYALNVPLLRLFIRQQNGEWEIDQEAVKRVAQTIGDSARPMVLYLFSTHFGVDTPMETHLAQSSDNLAWTQNGPLPKDKYYNVTIYPWSLARTDNELSLRREQAMAAVLDKVCGLPWSARQRVRAVSILGELHQLYPRFESGMGFDSAYEVTDYSPASVEGFRRYVENRFGNIAALNDAVGADYPDFDAVLPPRLDIRKDRLTRFQDHIDAYANGKLPVSGWLSVKGARAQDNWVHVYVNGRFVARTPARFGRQDVLAARPDLGTADVGWRHDLDFSGYEPGLYQIDLALESGGKALQYLGRRTVGVIDRTQAAPPVLPIQALPSMSKVDGQTEYFIDSPPDQLSVYFNPLVPVWHTYREHQVTEYLMHMAQVARSSCFGDVVYTHQIVPFTNPGWDATRFAIEDSLLPHKGISLGISLYGEPIYGDSVLNWLRGPSVERASALWTKPSRPYAITEFHPLKPMTRAEIRDALDRHWHQGVQFVSFFMEPRWQGERFEPGKNLFSIDPDNHQFGSNVLYESFSQLIGGKEKTTPPLRRLH